VLKLLLLPSFLTCRRLLNNRDEEETDAEHGPQSKKEDMIFSSCVCIYRALKSNDDAWRKDYLKGGPATSRLSHKNKNCLSSTTSARSL